MLLMIQSIVLEKWKRRTWVVSSGDGFSAQRAGEVEEDLVLRVQHGRVAMEGIGESVITTIPRARKVHQPLWAAPFSSLKCLWACLHVLTRWDAPDLILTNGPGTGVIVVLASLILRFCDFSGTGAGKTRVVYVESLARVRKLSLSGRLLVKVADRFLVQWKELEGVGEYVGAVTLDAVRNAGVVDAKAENKTDDTARTKARRIRFEI
jgi:beta-1,4-N-acetylglucosaminyltransferase